MAYAEINLIEDTLNKTFQAGTSSILPYCKINECSITSVCYDYHGIKFCSCKFMENHQECLS